MTWIEWSWYHITEKTKLIVSFLAKNLPTKKKEGSAKFVDLIMMLNKLLHGIKTYRDVFSEKQRLELFTNLVPYLQSWTEKHPGLQTPDSMHKVVNFPKIDHFTYDQCWMNFTDVNFPDWEAWHDHFNYKRTAVYYFYDCPGTIFKGKFGKFKIKGIANSIVTFPGNLIHTAPVNKSGARYTIAFNILEEWSSGLWLQS